MRMPMTWELLRRHPWVIRIGLAFALAVALGYGPHGIAGGAEARIETLRPQIAQTRDSIASLESENAKLRKRVRALKEDPRAIEEIARRDLGLVRPGELVIELGREHSKTVSAEVE